MTPQPSISLAPYTSLRVGGPADFFLAARSATDVAEALHWARERDLPVRIIGGGSNLLVAESGVAGLVIKAAYGQTDIAERDRETVLVAEAGANLANQARRLAKQGFGGLEWAANVPGTVGGAVVNNAGAFGGDTAGCLIAVTLIDASGDRTRVSMAQLGYGYRSSALKRHELGAVAVESAELRIWPTPNGEADARVKEFNAARMRTQPRVSSAGSVFANPEGTFSGKLIDDAGLKGTWRGGAQISEQHANFIVNPGRATARDVYALMRQTQDVVHDRFKVWLRPEIELLGRWTAEEREALLGPGVLAHG